MGIPLIKRVAIICMCLFVGTFAIVLYFSLLEKGMRGGISVVAATFSSTTAFIIGIYCLKNMTPNINKLIEEANKLEFLQRRVSDSQRKWLVGVILFLVAGVFLITALMP
jgi:hypothetical protein